MSLFKKKEKTCCSCNINALSQVSEITKGAKVKVLGTGCKKCNELEQHTLEALQELHMEPIVDHVTDLAQIATFGVMTTPALWINGSVVSTGKVLKKEEIMELLQRHMEETQ